ncbi:hypothetical protein AAFF_G00204910 [Aldrovandia affinis]|uniref:DUF4371 domain-containing protein n=1 Tax=Aldrovandia affinis TaxID=143900 RepID=A0AAD7RI26_9TELE|nr:hypothetical protein AAFF_G00204910 [Aldrovandia affinis]
MEKALEDVVVKQLDDKLKGSDFIGLIIDETVNITVDKKLIIYAKLEIKGRVETCFLGNYDVHSGPHGVYLTKWLRCSARGMWSYPVIGLGSDGASVMMGKRAGVGALLKKERVSSIQVHCGAHPELRWPR